MAFLRRQQRAGTTMGTWGTGNLENDGAQDELANVCERLFKEVIELIQHPRAHEYDDQEIDHLFVRIEMIFALHSRNMLSGTGILESIEPHFDPYVERWNRYQRDAGGGEWPERRAVIEETFDKLRAIAAEAGGSGLSHRLGLIAEKLSKPE